MTDNQILHESRRRIHKRGLAKSLRANPTDAERELWLFLKNKQFAGKKFRRQQPIGRYVVDFYCSELKLIIELDGEQHGQVTNQRRDSERSLWLERQGYYVLRFWNMELFTQQEAVFEALETAIRTIDQTPPRK